jgi:hypothetical protein
MHQNIGSHRFASGAKSGSPLMRTSDANSAGRIAGSDRRFSDAARGDYASARVLPVPDSRSPPAPELPSAGSGPVFPACSAVDCHGVASVPGCVHCRAVTFVPGYAARCRVVTLAPGYAARCRAVTFVPGSVGCRAVTFVPRYVVDCFLHRSLSPRCFAVEGFALPGFLLLRHSSWNRSWDYCCF